MSLMPIKYRFNGFLNISKPTNITSMEVVRKVKLLTGMRKRVGHGGTLDPLANGVLPICLGQATRLMEYIINGSKRYSMQIRLGISTTTYDSEGEVLSKKSATHITSRDVEEALDAFHELTLIEGIMPALETAHALAYVKKVAPSMDREKTIVVNISGRGDKDINIVAKIEGIKL